MLRSLSINGFKSLLEIENLELAPLTIFFGPNAAGKSNLVDALVVLSRLATSQTIAEAFGEPLRGNPLELFTLPPGGLADLLGRERSTFRIDATLSSHGGKRSLRYACEISIRPRSGTLSLEDEYLATLTTRGTPRGNPAIERSGDVIRVRRKSKPAHPWEERVGLHHTLLSNRRYSGKEYEAIEETRSVLTTFRSYYLDPRVAMRRAQPPREVDDIGALGADLAPFLYRLQAEYDKHFAAVRRTVRYLIPSVDDVVVDLDEKRGIVNIEIVQDGTPFSVRIVSEGTLRVLALAAMAVNPWGGSLIAFEEPENGVHPRRLELITELFWAMVAGAQGRERQVIVTTHSPLFCGSMVHLARREPDRVVLYQVVRRQGRTVFERLDPAAPLFTDAEIRSGLTSPTEDGMFEALWLRGLLDG